jgi:tRNA (guanosine-2'-O-)-methyltransferase
MIDIDYLTFLENILTDNRKERFLKVLEKPTSIILRLLLKMIFQMHKYKCGHAKL